MKPKLKVAYILDCFPVLSETFIVREILELQKNHFDVQVFARINTTDHAYGEVIHRDTKKLIKDVTYLTSLTKCTKIARWLEIALLHFYYLLKNPAIYLKLFFSSVRNGSQIFNNFIFAVLYAHKFQDLGIKHMHVHFALRACTYAMLISKLSGIPYSFTVHAHDIFIPNLAEMLEDKFNNSKFSVCISEFNKQFILKQFPSIKKDSIQIVHCGLDLSAFPHNTINSNKPTNIVSIGRLVEHKGFKYLIEACKKVRDEGGPEFTCNIIGEGEERKLLEDLISKFELSDVIHLHGSMEQLDVVNILNNADIFILPCVTEENGMQDGIPVALMEAMAMKIPVISTIVSGVPELIQNGAGLLVEQRDVEGLFLAMIKIMTLAEKEKELMVDRGRVIIEENFNIEKETQKLAELMSC